MQKVNKTAKKLRVGENPSYRRATLSRMRELASYRTVPTPAFVVRAFVVRAFVLGNVLAAVRLTHSIKAAIINVFWPHLRSTDVPYHVFFIWKPPIKHAYEALYCGVNNISRFFRINIFSLFCANYYITCVVIDYRTFFCMLHIICLKYT